MRFAGKISDHRVDLRDADLHEPRKGTPAKPPGERKKPRTLS